MRSRKRGRWPRAAAWAVVVIGAGAWGYAMLCTLRGLAELLS